MNRSYPEVGVITRGSLLEGVEMKLSPSQSVEDVKSGKFVVIEGEKNEFFSMITDVRLDAINPDILIHPPSPDDQVMRAVLPGTSTYATVCLRPMLMLPKGADGLGETRPVKTIPPHFSPVYDAEEHDVARIFGREGEDPRFFAVGKPLDMETPVCLNLQRFVERSNGIFGKSGTGKTFLTRVVLAGLIKQGDAVNLIFDMHSEYGWDSRKESASGHETFVPGLKKLFGQRVAVFTLDPESNRRRGVKADYDVVIPFGDVTIDDIALLADELKLNQTAVEASNMLVNHYGENWLRTLLAQSEGDVREFAETVGAHPESLAALYRKLKRLERLDFLSPTRPSTNTVEQIMNCLSRGIHVVLEFGRQTSMLCYLLVANILTRRIHELYVSQTEQFLSTKRSEEKPRPLVITIEEAHKFLNPSAARQTTFGIIAREMRKFFVSLLIVDQRPSGIDDEVISQIGTRITALLNDDKDIQAVLTGVSNSEGLRGVLASLDSKQQALVMGHAVPMPVVVRTRDYDEAFYKAMGMVDEKERKAQTAKKTQDLFGS